MADLGNTAVISPTDASNGSGTMPSWLGSAAPSTLDDAGRAFQGAVAREWENRSYPTATGTSPAYVVTYTVAPAALRSGQTYTFTAHAAASGTDTLNANTLGAKGIKKVVAGTKTATAANDFYEGDKIACVYDGTDMVWANYQGANSTAATTTQQLTGTSTAVASTPDSVAALWEAGADIADGATITIGEGGYFNLITSTTAITAFTVTTDKAGRTFRCRFNTIRTLTHSGTALILPAAANITTAAGDIAQFRSLGTGTTNVVCEWYTKANGTALVSSAGTAASQAEQETGTEAAKYIAPATQQFHPSAAKFWVRATANSTTIVVSYNMTSWADTATGKATGTIATDFSGADWCPHLMVIDSLGGAANITTSVMESTAAGTFITNYYEAAGTDLGGDTALHDPVTWMVAGFGDQ